MRKCQRFFLTLFICMIITSMILPSYAYAAVLSPPTHLTATAVSSNQIDLQWGSVDDATSYAVSRAISYTGTYELVATVSEDENTYSDHALLFSTTYYYRVTALNGSESSIPAEISAKTLDPDKAPDSPKNLKAEPISYSTIKLTWDLVSEASYYIVFRATTETGDYISLDYVDVPTYIDTGFTANQTYYYKVQASNMKGTSADSTVVSATTKPAPSSPTAPTTLTATATSSSSISVTWSTVSTATSYDVYRATSSGSYSKAASVSTNSYSDTGLLASTTYYYKVQAHNISGASDFSPIDDATTGVPAAPKNLDADDTRDRSIYLSWDSVKEATGYYIYREDSSGTYNKIATVDKTSYTNTGLTVDRTYYYKVQAYNVIGSSGFSNSAYATVTDETSSPDAPDDLNATTESSSKIYLDWDTVDNASNYYVYRATSSTGTYSKIATISSENYTDTNLSANTRYYYKVKAHNAYGVSSYSSYAYATTKASSSYGDNIERLAGKNRYETAAKIAEEGWTSSYYAVIASGEDFPDALCGTPLAGKYDSPVLLTSRYNLESQTRNALTNLNVQEVFIIGGTGVISSTVEQTIKNMGITVIRLAGNDRYETSVKVAEKMGYVNQAIIATGDNFPDALSIAPIASMKGFPILLTAKDQLSGVVKTYLKNNIQSTVVVGGNGVISSYVYNQVPSPKRLSGNDRYETNLNIVKAYINTLDFDTSYIATGEDFPDALAGSALASANQSPILLVSSVTSQATKDFLSNRDVDKITALGGTGVVTDSVLLSLGSSILGPSSTISTPDNLSATTLSSNEIYLNWDSVSSATSYYIYRATSYSGTYSKIDTVSTSYYYDTNVSDDTIYYYKVQAHNSSGTSAYSSVTYATTDSEISLDTPTNLDAIALSSSSIFLTWDAVDGSTSYYIYRATSSAGTYTKIATVYNEYYTNTNLTANKTYYYKVQAHNSSDTSGYSARAYATTD